MYYDKRIRYLSYYESDIKLQNAGYAKFQVRDSLCQMIIYVKGPRLIGNGEAMVYLLTRGQEASDNDSFYSGGRDSRLQKHLLGNLSIRGGQGHCAVRMNAENMADSGLRYDEICGIRIELHEYQYLESQWNVVNFMPGRQEMPGGSSKGYQLRQPQIIDRDSEGGSRYDRGDEMPERRADREGSIPPEEPVKVDLIVTPVSENVRVEKLVREEPIAEPVYEEIKREEPQENALAEGQSEGDGREAAAEQRTVKQNTVEQTAEDVKAADADKELSEMAEEKEPEQILSKDDGADSMQELLEREVMSAESEDQEISSAESEPGDRELKSDKWEQLRNTYPIIHPIREEEEYLKVSPRDFVIFTEKYQQLVHNSFLLHGYHNYKHLILGKKEKDGKVVYYLGVPGSFHDREKAVAVMFGFEAFDGKREPAQTGDFGYYLRRVEL